MTEKPIEVKHKNKTLYFYPKEHKYVDKNDKKYTSVTTLVHQFFPKFDSKRIARMCVNNPNTKYFRRGIDDVLLEWNENGQQAAKFGKHVHKYAECKLLGESLPIPESDQEAKMFKNVEKFVENLLKEYKLLESELIIFSEKFGVSRHGRPSDGKKIQQKYLHLRLEN